MNMELYNLARLVVEAANKYMDPFDVDPEGPYYEVADVDLRSYFVSGRIGCVQWTASLGKYSVGPRYSPNAALHGLKELYNEKIEQLEQQVKEK